MIDRATEMQVRELVRREMDARLRSPVLNSNVTPRSMSQGRVAKRLVTNLPRVAQEFDEVHLRSGDDVIPYVFRDGEWTPLTVADGAITEAKMSTLTWTAPTLLNSWVNFDTSTYSAAGYVKDHSGFVHLRGLVKNGTFGNPVFVLPVGHRPAKTQHFACASNGAFGYVRVEGSNGDVDAVAGSSTWFSLDGITFDTRS